MKNTGTARIVFPLLLTCDKLKCVRPQAEEVVARSNKECHEWECAHEDGSNMEGSSEAARNELARVCAAPRFIHTLFEMRPLPYHTVGLSRDQSEGSRARIAESVKGAPMTP